MGDIIKAGLVGLGLGLLSRLIGGRSKKAKEQVKSLSDVDFLSASETEPISICYGTNQISGNVLWGGNFKVVHEKVGGHVGKGGLFSGGESQYITKYTISLVIGLCEGHDDLTLLKMWSNDKEIEIPHPQVTFYNGSTTQNPDSHVLANQTDLVEGWRNTAHVVLSNWSLGTGTALPNLQFEVGLLLSEMQGPWGEVGDPTPWGSRTTLGMVSCYDTAAGAQKLWAVGETYSDPDFIFNLYSLNESTDTWELKDSITSTSSTASHSSLFCLNGNLFLIVAEGSSVASRGIWKYDFSTETLTQVENDAPCGQLTISGTTLYATMYGSGVYNSVNDGDTWSQLYTAPHGQTKGIAFFGGLMYVSGNTGLTGKIHCRVGAAWEERYGIPSNRTRDVLFAYESVSTTELLALTSANSTWGASSSITGAAGTWVENTIPGDMRTGGANFNIYNDGTNWHIPAQDTSNLFSLLTKIIGTTAWVYEGPTGSDPTTIDETFIVQHRGKMYISIDSTIWSLIYVPAEGDDVNPILILRDLMQHTRYGLSLTAKMNDTSFLTRAGEIEWGISMLIRGREEARQVATDILIITRTRMFPRAGVFVLASLEDYSLAFSTITDDDFKIPVREPRRLRSTANKMLLEYFDRGQGYRRGFASGEDEGNQDRTKLRQENFRTRAVIAPNKAKEIAYELLTQSLHKGVSFGAEIRRKYLALEPGDLIPVYDALIGTRNVRTSTLLVGDDTIKIESYEDTAALTTAITPTAQLSVSTFPPGGTLGGVQTPQMVELPRHFNNEVLGIVPIFGAATSPSLYAGANLYHSSDGTSYSKITSNVQASVFGTLAATLDGGWWYKKDIQVNVDYVVGSPNSVSHTDLFQGKAALLVGNELMFYESVTALPSSVFQVQGLIRGRGDTAVVTHPSNTNVYFVNPSMLSIDISLARASTGVTQYYKIASIDIYGNEQSLANATELTLAPVGLAWRPYPGGNLQSVVGNGAEPPVSFNWEKVSALYGAGSFAPAKSPSQDAIMEDNWKDYLINIVVDGSIVRTETQTTMSYTYSSANNISDNGSYRSNFTFKVWGRNLQLERSRLTSEVLT